MAHASRTAADRTRRIAAGGPAAADGSDSEPSLADIVRGLEFDVLEASPTRVERLVIRSGATPPVPLSPGGA